MPVATSDYELATTSAVAVDRSARGKLVVTGSEAADFLQGQVSNDVEALAPGQGCYAALLNHKGKIRCDMRILRGADAPQGGTGWFQLDCEPQALPVLLHMLRMYSIGRDVQYEDVSAQSGLWSVIGPAARDALQLDLPHEEHAHADGPLGLYAATDLGVDVFGERPDLPEAGVEVAECLRIEAGRPRLGFELGDDVIPQEAGINERAISFTKGCYVGQETVARLHYKGKPNRHLRGLRLSAPAGRGEPVFLGERQVALIGSECTSPAKGPIALALVRREASPGDTVEVGESRTAAEVVELPF
jgi:folate-binding protein YgfZ